MVASVDTDAGPGAMANASAGSGACACAGVGAGFAAAAAAAAVDSITSFKKTQIPPPGEIQRGTLPCLIQNGKDPLGLFSRILLGGPGEQIL